MREESVPQEHELNSALNPALLCTPSRYCAASNVLIDVSIDSIINMRAELENCTVPRATHCDTPHCQRAKA